MRVVALLLLTLLALPSRADDTSEAREHFRNGQTHYSLGEFQEAVTEFREAYRLRHEPAILFNIAQAMRQMGQFKQSYFYYRQYLAQKPDAPNRAEVEQLVAQMKKKVDAEEQAERERAERENARPAPGAQYPEDHLEETDPAKAPAAGKTAFNAVAKPKPAPAPALPGSPAAPAPAKDGTPVARIGGYVALGVGAVAEGAAFALHSSAASTASQFNQLYASGQLTANDAHLKTDAQSRGSMATVAFVGGALLVVTGATLAFAF